MTHEEMLDPRIVESRMYKETIAQLLRERKDRGGSPEDIERAEQALKHACVAVSFAVKGRWPEYAWKLRVRGIPLLTDRERVWVMRREEQRLRFLAANMPKPTPKPEPTRESITPETGKIETEGRAVTRVEWESGRSFNTPTVIEKFQKRFEKATR